MEAPENAIPAEEAARIILEGVVNKKGIILMPEQPCGWLWSEYCTSSDAAESYLLKLAHDRRIKWSTRQKM